MNLFKEIWLWCFVGSERIKLEKKYGSLWKLMERNNNLIEREK